MFQNLDNNRILWLLTALLSLTAALIGVFNPSIYSKVVSPDFIPGSISQDLMTITASILVLFLTLRIKERNSKKQIVILSILGYLFYAYGIYVIERFYNVLYLMYMAIFALAFYSIVYAVASIRQDILQKVKLSRLMRKVSVGFSLLIPLLFYPLWISQLLPLLQTGKKIESAYSIYILDMCFILPLFIVIPIMAAKNKGFGLLMLPVLFIKGFTLLFSVGLGGILKPFFNQTANIGETWFYLGISIVFLVLTVVYLRNLKIDEETID